MSFLPLLASRGMTIIKNYGTGFDTVLASDARLDYMLLPLNFTAEMSRCLTLSPYPSFDNVKNMVFQGTPGTNPSILWSTLSEGLSLMGDTSSYCNSVGILDKLLSDNDTLSFFYGSDRNNAIIITRSGTIGSLIGLNLRIKTNGTVQAASTTFYCGETGTGAETEYWRLALGVMVDLTNQKAWPFLVHGHYHSPFTAYENVRLQQLFYTDALIASCMPYVYRVVSDVPPEYVTDPYVDGGGASETVVPDGTFDDSSDSISLPSAPALNLALTKFISAYSPNITQLNSLASWIWGDYSGADRFIAKFFADPTDAIISLHMLPFTPSTSTNVHVMIGNYDTLEEMPPITTQFTDVDCGSLTIEPYWDNYLDYNPYTRLTLALPYVGEVQLDPDEVMGETVNVLYRVDVLSGAFVCFISTTDKILAQYAGNCALTVPISSASYAQANAAILGLASAAIGLGTASVGYSAAMEAGSMTELAKAGGGMMNAAAGVGSSAMGVMNAKVNHSHSGSISGTAGFLGAQKPYLLIHRARQSVPAYANKFHGYPCNVTMNLNDVVGFTSIKNIILDGLPFTQGEINDLRLILAAGIRIYGGDVK